MASRVKGGGPWGGELHRGPSGSGVPSHARTRPSSVVGLVLFYLVVAIVHSMFLLALAPAFPEHSHTPEALLLPKTCSAGFLHADSLAGS